MTIRKGDFVKFKKDTQTADGIYKKDDVVEVISTGAKIKIKMKSLKKKDEFVIFSIQSKGFDNYFEKLSPDETNKYKEKNRIVEFTCKKGDAFELTKDIKLNEKFSIPKGLRIVVKKGGSNPIFTCSLEDYNFIDFNIVNSNEYTNLKSVSNNILEKEFDGWLVDKIKINKSRSFESNNFTASLTYNNKVVAEVSDDGYGGAISYYPVDKNKFNEFTSLLRQFYSSEVERLKNEEGLYHKGNNINEHESSLLDFFVNYFVENENALKTFKQKIKDDIISSNEFHKKYNM